jgi:cytochrome P450
MDTSSNVIGTGVYFLSKYPEVQKKIREEINEKVKNLEDLTWDKLNELDYLYAFI